MPRYEGSALADLKVVEQLRGRTSVRVPIQCQIDKYVRVDEDHRYFLESASYLGSSRSAASNLPRQREAKDGASPETRSRSSVSMSDESEIPLDRAYRFAIGTSSPGVLNYGDCLAYGVAMAAREPLLFKGDDFGQTDVGVAVY